MKAAGWGVWRLSKGLCSQYVSILGGRGLGWTLQDEQGEDSLKRTKLFSVFSDLCCMSSHPDYSPSSLLSLTDWCTGPIVVLCLTAASLSHPLISLQPIFYLNSIETRRFVFPSSSPHQSLSWKKVGKEDEGAGDETNLFGFYLTQCFSFEFPHILLVTSLNGAPDEVLFLWLFTWIPKTPWWHFTPVFDFKAVC